MPNVDLSGQLSAPRCEYCGRAKIVCEDCVVRKIYFCVVCNWKSFIAHLFEQHDCTNLPQIR